MVAGLGQSGSGAVPGDLSVGGAGLAGELSRRDLVDVYRLVVHPVILGGGTPFFADGQPPIGPRLVATRRFSTGAVPLD